MTDNGKAYVSCACPNACKEIIAKERQCENLISEVEKSDALHKGLDVCMQDHVGGNQNEAIMSSGF